MTGPQLKLLNTNAGVVLDRDGELFAPGPSWDALIDWRDLPGYLTEVEYARIRPEQLPPLRAPVLMQEVWAAGVTYQRSRTARREEAREAGGGSFYDRVYDAQRPELFFKAAGWRVKGPDAPIRVRRDSRWTVPEPELAAYFNSRGQLIGFSIANDVSARDIEGENPLYLPQAKIYDGACALGPALLVTPDPLPPETTITLRITRGDDVACEGTTTLAQLRRTPAELGAWLFQETSFPSGCILLTGTGIVPPAEFSLRPGDQVSITIPPIGTLTNPVA